MTNQQHEKFQEHADSAVYALEMLMRLTLSDKDMNGTSAMNQFDMLEAAKRKIEIVSIRKHEKMENKDLPKNN
jgi:hypothetical protein|tara:strand:- start:168 stop:386 length:219 start_codon:yes stop_codon:yes gene_type:complete